MATFEELGVGKWLTKQLNEYGLTEPTPVQVYIQFNIFVSHLLNFLTSLYFRQIVFPKFLMDPMSLDVRKPERVKHWHLRYPFYKSSPSILMEFLPLF